MGSGGGPWPSGEQIGKRRSFCGEGRGMACPIAELRSGRPDVTVVGGCALRAETGEGGQRQVVRMADCGWARTALISREK